MADRLRTYPAVATVDARGAFLGQFDGIDDWVPMPVGPGDIVWRPAAGGRLAELVGRDGRPLLRTAPPCGEPGAAEFPALVGLHAGRLRVLG